MASKNVNILLKLQDKFTSPMVKAGKITKEQQRALAKCSSEVMGFSRKVRTGFLGGVTHVAKFGAALAVVSFARITAGFAALSETTEEYRKAMGKLNTAFEAAGFTAKTAQKSYKAFYGILGDTDTATEASQLLAKLTKNEKDVSTWTRIAAGVSGTFGDALPIEGLIEASNETAKVGKVAGVLADALNWAGISEDAFNVKLAAAGNEAGRNQLIMETLGRTYETAAAAFYKNNEALVKSREQQAALQRVTGTLGEASAIAKGKLMELFWAAADGSVQSGSALAWISQQATAFRDKLNSLDASKYVPKVTAAIQSVKDGVTTAWGVISPILGFAVKHADTLIPAILGVTAAISSISIVADVATKVDSAIKTFNIMRETIGQARAAVSGMGGILNLVSSGPLAIIVIAIGAVIAVGVLLYKNWDTIKAKAQALWNAVLTLKDKFVSAFQAIRDKVSSIVKKIKAFLQPLIDLIGRIKDGLSSLGFGKGGQQPTLSTYGGKATGTPYFQGGLTRINEGGRGEIVDLPNGTRIIPHDVAEKTQGGTSVVVNLTVQGNVIGNRAYMEQTGAYIAKKILEAQGVV